VTATGPLAVWQSRLSTWSVAGTPTWIAAGRAQDRDDLAVGAGQGACWHSTAARC
jgi:hypothetical protein